ncbi:hypothetical protein PsorP6_017428 [Peronosclerospora sorghi]|uniref:Uncharacterized protein n=1 Tax=Peronosclerospora sorghi TaxID=230839 RepID=A0ACC0WLN1_9STRA|nr:hypothetical protein PsorP6_017428 [Peronosclerospora sorghi]
MSRHHHNKDHRRSVSPSHNKSSHRSEDKRLSRHKSSKHDKSKRPKGVKKITNEDYFLRQTEFRVWLAQTKSKYVDDLSTEEATELFNVDFAKKWNRGKLHKMFYEGLPEAVVEQTKRTRHNWGFVAKLGEKEKFELATTKDSVDVATKDQKLLTFNGDKQGKRVTMEEETTKYRSSGKRQTIEKNEDDRDESRKRRKRDGRKEQEYLNTVIDELAPKATGREAQIEKRRQAAAKLHGAARDREETRDGLDLSDDFLLGGSGGDDELKHQMLRRKIARLRKLEKQEEKVAELQVLCYKS